jgi:hypothetical protein
MTYGRGVARDCRSGWPTLLRRIYLDTDTLQTLYDYGETLPIHSPMRIRITRRSLRLTSRMLAGGARPFWVTGAGATFQ